MNARPTPQQQAIDKAIDERSRLYRNYVRAKKADHERLYQTEPHGQALKKFNATLGHFGIEDSDDLIRYVRKQSEWLLSAPEDIRFAALQMLGHRIVRIRQRAGLLPYDDPLPNEENDVYRICRQELGL